MTFALPNAFWLMVFIPVFFAAKFLGDRRVRQQSGAYLQPGAASPVAGRAALWSVMVLWALAWACLTTALARPQSGEERIEAAVESRQIFFALDVSKSMLGQDIAPNRLDRAKLLIRDIVREFPNDRIGLIVFAGTAFVQAPLTNDHQALDDVLDAVDYSIIPRGGTNISRALRLAVDTFQRESAASQAVVLISDGDELEGEALATAREAKEQGVRVYSVGAGTDSGAIIPDPDLPGDFIRHGDENEIVRTRLQTELLREVASITGGKYYQLTNNLALVDEIAEPLRDLDQATETTKAFVKPIESFHWFLIPGIVLLLLGWCLETLLTRPPAPVAISGDTSNP